MTARHSTLATTVLSHMCEQRTEEAAQTEGGGAGERPRPRAAARAAKNATGGAILSTKRAVPKATKKAAESGVARR